MAGGNPETAGACANGHPAPTPAWGTCAYAQSAELPLQIDLLQHADWPSVETLAITQALLVFQLLLVLLECISLSLPTTIGMYLSGPAFLKLVPLGLRF